MAGKSQSTVESKVENANKRPAASLISAPAQRIAIVAVFQEVRLRLHKMISIPQEARPRLLVRLRSRSQSESPVPQSQSPVFPAKLAAARRALTTRSTSTHATTNRKSGTKR
jgi:hypothetical protein